MKRRRLTKSHIDLGLSRASRAATKKVVNVSGATTKGQHKKASFISVTAPLSSRARTLFQLAPRMTRSTVSPYPGI